jgi:hypothetical protein
VGGCSTPYPDHFTPGKDPVPILYEAGWDPGSVWTGAVNLASTGIRSPDRPARSESLYRLSYPGPHSISVTESVQKVEHTSLLLFLAKGVSTCSPFGRRDSDFVSFATQQHNTHRSSSSYSRMTSCTAP